MPEFDEQSAKRISAAVKYVEGQYRNTALGYNGQVETPFKKIGKLTTALTARSGSTPGSGTVQPYLMTKTSIAASGDTQTIYNPTGSAVPSGSLVYYTVIDGLLAFDGNDCSTVGAP
jgi:hypothetical protein